MGVMKLNDFVYSVGVLNPALRVFDIIMKTEYGTTYNAYLLKTKEIALIETVHEKFFDEYLENLKSLTDLKDIKYLILNHTEPDHAGSVRKLIEMCPEIKVYASAAAAKYLKGISNRDIATNVVKDGDTLDIGGKKCRFISAPFLHWPDSMFTYFEDDALIFTCDFLGAHYCEPRMLDKYISYPEKYAYAFESYYRAIFAPFKEHVLSGLDKIKDLKIDMVCTGHGPVLVSGIAECMDKYLKWSAQKPKSGRKMLILYVSAYGYTRKLAHAALEAAKSIGIEAEALDVIENDYAAIKEKIEEADILMFGSPTINRDALKPIWDCLNMTDATANRGKSVGIFGSYGWSGEAVGMLKQRAEGLKLKVCGDGFRVNFAPDEKDLEAMKEYTKQVIAMQ